MQMVEYKDIWSDTLLIIALLISVFAFSGYSPDVSTPSFQAPQTELIFSQQEEAQVLPISIVLNPCEGAATPPRFAPFAVEAMRIQATLERVSLAQLSQTWLQWSPTNRFPFLLPLRQCPDEATHFQS